MGRPPPEGAYALRKAALRGEDAPRLTCCARRLHDLRATLVAGNLEAGIPHRMRADSQNRATEGTCADTASVQRCICVERPRQFTTQVGRSV